MRKLLLATTAALGLAVSAGVAQAAIINVWTGANNLDIVADQLSAK